MKTNKLKSFAPKCRIDLMNQVGVKLDYVLTAKTPDLAEKEDLLKDLRRALEKEGRQALIERVAYTWFNRFAAFRYLDAHNWHPFKARLISPLNPGDVLPELLQRASKGDLPEELKPFVSMQRIGQLLDGELKSANPQAEVQRLLVIGVSQYYANLLSFLFSKIDAFTELLLPDDLLTEHSVVHGFITEIAEEDCMEVEVLGWLYQFYISEKKDEVMGRKKAVPSEDIPAVTQLFTPHWIVRYLVENSLGRLWLNSRPNSRLKEHMPYYVDDPDGQKPPDSLTVATPEEIKLLDPACGSGHMLTYAFDLLVKIYEEEGHAPSEIPEKILTHNLHGLEICPRAAQLTNFSLLCKARDQSRSAFRRPVQPQVMYLRDVVLTLDEVKGFTDATGITFSQDELSQIHQFRENTETFGALIQPVLAADKLADLAVKIGEQAPDGDLLVQNTYGKLRLVLDQAEMLSKRYKVVVANPPYMGGRFLNDRIKSFSNAQFPRSKADTFAMFIERSFSFTISDGLSALVTMQSWMFLASFAEMRKEILQTKEIVSLVQMANMVMGIAFGTAAFVIRNGCPRADFKSQFSFVELTDINASTGRPREFPVPNSKLAQLSTLALLNIPSTPVAYWLGKDSFEAFSRFPSLGKLARAKSGQNTGDNDRFTRRWFEVPIFCVDFNCASLEDTKTGDYRWYPYNKGGQFRKWYGNFDMVINWEFDGKEVKEYAVERNKGKHWSRYIQNLDCMLKEGLTWSFISSSYFGIRYTPHGHFFDYAGCSLFTEKLNLKFLLTLLCSKIAPHFIRAINPTLNYQPGTIASIPINSSVGIEVETILEPVPLRQGVDGQGFELKKNEPKRRKNLALAQKGAL